MKVLLVVVLALGAFLGYGIWAYTRLSNPAPQQTYGFPTGRAEAPIRIEEAVAKAKMSPRPPVLDIEGKVVDMGPTMGCWLLVQDGTGEVLVQTEPMVYMPQALRGATVRVSGTVVHGRFRGMGYRREGWFLFAPGVEVEKARS